MTWKVSLSAALVTLVLMPLAFATEAGILQATTDPDRITAAQVAQPNQAASTKSINAYVRLFEKGDMAGDVVCTFPITVAPYDVEENFKKNSCSNDEAVSISFANIPAGSTVSLYDDPNCGEGDDWVKFTFFWEVAFTYAHDFQITDNKKIGDRVVYSQVYHDHGRLNGKVSCINIHVPEPH